jgi:transcriptional regulator GlxA family with amidase domain
MAEVLVVAGDAAAADRYRAELCTYGVDVATAIGLTAAATLAERRHFDVIAIEMDAQRPPHADLLRTLTARHPESAVVMVTGRGVADAVAAVMLAPPPGDAATPVHPRVHGALGHIAERFREPGCSARAIARSEGVSEEYLCRLMKAHTGRTIGSLVHEARLREAARLLVATAWSVKEIAGTVGYSSSGHLDRHFRRVYRANPVAFRRARASR